MKIKKYFGEIFTKFCKFVSTFCFINSNLSAEISTVFELRLLISDCTQ